MTFRRELNVLIGCGGGEDEGDSYGDDGSLQGHLLGRDWGIGSWGLRTGVVALASGARRWCDGNFWLHGQAGPGLLVTAKTTSLPP